MSSDTETPEDPHVPGTSLIDALGQLPEPFEEPPVLSVEGDETPAEPAADWKQYLPMAGVFAAALYVTATSLMLMNRPTVIREKSGPTVARSTNKTTSRDAASPQTIESADALMREGNFARAKEIYSQLTESENEGVGLAPTPLKYRLALCEEALGHNEEALTLFRELADGSASDMLRRVSRVSQARIWFRLEDRSRVRQMLGMLPLEKEADDIESHPVTAEGLYLLAMSSQYLDHPTEIPAHEPKVARAPTDWPIDSVLLWTDELSDEENKKRSGKRATEGRRRRQELTSELLSLPYASLVTMPMQESSVTDLLKSVATEAKYSLEVSEKASVGLKDRTSRGLGGTLPLALALNGLTDPYLMHWTIVEKKIFITVPDEEVATPEASEDEDADGNPKRPIVVRARDSITSELGLRLTVARFPQHRLVAAANLEIGNVLYERNAFTQCLVEYQDLTRRVSTPTAVAAAYNAGLAHRKLSRVEEARAAFYRVVDGNPEHHLAPVAAYLIGRMMLDNGQTREAVGPLEFAARAKISGESRAASSVYAAMAHLLNDSYHEAGQILFANNAAFQEQSVLRDAAAFLNSYSRYLMLSGSSERQRRETIYLFRSLFALGPNPTWMGSYGMLLVGRAYRDLGMSAQMRRVFDIALNDGAQGVIAAEMRYLTLESQIEGHTASTEVRDLLQKFSVAEFDNKWGQLARLTLARLDLHQGKHAEAIATCRQLLKVEHIESFAALKIMGQAYERLGQARNAALCFAGQAPPEK